jgi:acetyltransferase-like isoleucine patch superfamily enzyme
MPKKIMDQLSEPSHSLLGQYRMLCVESSSFLFFLYYELVTFLFGGMSGALGLAARAIAYRPLFKKIGRKVVFGKNLALRYPDRISLGDHVIIDENVVLDAKGETGHGISIGDYSFISRNVILSCKEGGISIGNHSTVGPFSTIHSVGAATVDVGDYCSLANYCYLIGSGNYKMQDQALPMCLQGLEEGKGIKIGKDVWLGAAVIVTDGVCIGERVVVGAHSLVRHNLPSGSFAYGIPASIKERKQKA